MTAIRDRFTLPTRLAMTLVACCSSSLLAADAPKRLVYEGTWLTTNRQLDGTMTCNLAQLGDERWRGTFYGVWYGQEFSYTVDFRGPPEKLRGRAVVDGANYEWTGAISKGRFKGEFWGDRYLGSFDLKRKAKE